MKNYISIELKALCERLLKHENYATISDETGFSYGYVKDVKNRVRYNEKIEEALKNACRKALEELKQSLDLTELL